MATVLVVYKVLQLCSFSAACTINARCLFLTSHYFSALIDSGIISGLPFSLSPRDKGASVRLCGHDLLGGGGTSSHRRDWQWRFCRRRRDTLSLRRLSHPSASEPLAAMRPSGLWWRLLFWGSVLMTWRCKKSWSSHSLFQWHHLQHPVWGRHHAAGVLLLSALPQRHPPRWTNIPARHEGTMVRETPPAPPKKTSPVWPEVNAQLYSPVKCHVAKQTFFNETYDRVTTLILAVHKLFMLFPGQFNLNPQ